jgi:hypothetical protein
VFEYWCGKPSWAESELAVALRGLCAVLAPVFLYALINSALVTLRQGGIRWRDTFYSLETLRTGTLR